MLFRTLPVEPGCNKVSENERTSGNRYSSDLYHFAIVCMRQAYRLGGGSVHFMANRYQARLWRKRFTWVPEQCDAR